MKLKLIKEIPDVTPNPPIGTVFEGARKLNSGNYKVKYLTRDYILFPKEVEVIEE